jgi:LPS sulfotransferase NodH
MNIFSSRYWFTQVRVKIKQLLNVLPVFKKDTYTKFLIVGHPRTGTSLLHTYLNSHWHVVSLNEPLSGTIDTNILFKKQSMLIDAIGFKYFYEYTEDILKRNILVELLKQGDIKIIKIERRNYLRTYVSRCIAEKTNEWSSTQVKQHSIERKKITLTKQECLNAFARYQKSEQDTEIIIKVCNVPVFKTEYETLVANPSATMFAIQNFLGVTRQTPLSLLVRQNAEPLNMLIENYENLKASFSGTEFEIFFDE